MPPVLIWAIAMNGNKKANTNTNFKSNDFSTAIKDINDLAMY